MTTTNAIKHWLTVVAIIALCIAGVISALALIKLFGDVVCLVVLAAFISLTIYAWRKTNRYEAD